MTNPTISADVIEAARQAGLHRPSWVTAVLFPNEGEWTEADFLALPTNRLVELSDGHLEVLDMPTKRHQAIAYFLATALKAFFRRLSSDAEVIMAPYPMRLWTNKFREPDVVCLLPEHAQRCGETHADGADLVVEVVSSNHPERDTEVKRLEYAKAGIPEYWIVNPDAETVTVLTLSGEAYTEHGVFVAGQRATSPLLPGFVVDVAQALAGA